MIEVITVDSRSLNDQKKTPELYSRLIPNL